MTDEHLDNTLKVGDLQSEAATTRKISDLIRSGTARLADTKRAPSVLNTDSIWLTTPHTPFPGSVANRWLSLRQPLSGVPVPSTYAGYVKLAVAGA